MIPRRLRNSIYLAIALTIMWVIFNENASPLTFLVGGLVSSACIWFTNRYIPSRLDLPINFFKLALYGIFLIGQVYMSGFNVIKLILTGATSELVETTTEIEDVSLRAILAASITLTPGSSVISLDGNKLTIVWMRKHPVADPGAVLKGKLEERVMRVKSR